MPLQTFDRRTIKEGVEWKVLWEGKLLGRQTLSYDFTPYRYLRIYAMSWGNTIIFDLDLTKTVPNHNEGMGSYSYVASASGGVINSSSQWEEHQIECGVNSAKTTFYNGNQGYSVGTTQNLRNNNSDYYVYRIEGLVNTEAIQPHEDGTTEEYSTTEVVTNKIWVDGKQIYRKVITGTNSSSTSFTVSLGITNVDQFVNIDARLLRTGDYTQNSNIGQYYWTSTDYWNCYLSTPSSKQLTIRGGSDWPKRPYDYAIILEYTKTTS